MSAVSMVTPLIVPLMVGTVIVLGLCGNVKVYDAFVEGAVGGLKTLMSIVAPIVALMTAITMFRASGALPLIAHGLRNIGIGIPEEVVPLALMRPISGSGALGVLNDILKNNGPDSRVGLIASVICGSTETTFYALSVYFGATKVERVRHTIAVALICDLAAIVLGVLIINFVF